MKPRENPIFSKIAKIVISVKIKNFLDLGCRNGFHRWNRLVKSSYHVEFRRIPRQSEFARFSRKRASGGTLGAFLSGTQGATCQDPIQST